MAEQQTTESQTANRVVALGVDGSEQCKFAFQFYLKNVRKPGDKVVFIHSVEVAQLLQATNWYNTPFSFDKNVVAQLLDDEKEKIKHRLEGYATMLRDAKVDGTVKSIHAESPGHGIIKAADEIGATLIIVGCRGLGTIRRTFMGSVSEYVLHHAHVPVLVCRHDKDDHQKQDH